MRGAQSSFNLEAHESIGVGRKSLRQDLQCDTPAKFRVEDSVDVSRATRAQPRLDFVGAEFRARGERSSLSRHCNPALHLAAIRSILERLPPALTTFGTKEEMHAAIDRYFLLFESKCPEAPMNSADA